MMRWEDYLNTCLSLDAHMSHSWAVKNIIVILIKLVVVVIDRTFIKLAHDSSDFENIYDSS